jgi:preprotein translocase subunit SecG
MNTLFTVILVVHVLVSAGIIGLVLIQHGKGADMGAAFGSGSSGSLFGATGSANFLSRTTAVLATAFFVTSIGLTWMASRPHTVDSGSVMQGMGEPAATAPAKEPGKEAAPVPADKKEAAPAAPAAPVSSGHDEVPK